jgi:hypothetical protein
LQIKDVFKGTRHNIRLTRNARLHRLKASVTVEPLNLQAFVFQIAQLLGQHQRQMVKAVVGR